MPPEYGMTAGAAHGVVNRRPRRLFGISSERKSPLNIQFERQVARVESRQQQQRCIILTVIPFNLSCDFKSHPLTENGNNHLSSEFTSPEESFVPSSLTPASPPVIFLHFNAPDDSSRRWLDNPSRLVEDKSTSSNSMPHSDFLVNSFTKSSANAGHTARRKSKKKNKKHRQRCKKSTDGSQAKCRDSNSAAPATDVGDCEDLSLSPKHVADIEFVETYSPSSSVKEASEEAPESENDNEYRCCSGGSVSSVSDCDEIELSRSTSSCPGLCGRYNTSDSMYLGDTPNSIFSNSSQQTCCAGDNMNCSHDTKTLFAFRNECGANLCEATEFRNSSSGSDENWLEKSDYGSGICSQNGVSTCSGVQRVNFCGDKNSDSDFSLVISRKRARKEKKMSLWKSYSYGEHTSTDTHGRNGKHVGCSSRLMTKELNTNDLSHKQNHVHGILPQCGVVLKHANNFMHKPSNVCTETQNEVPTKGSKLGASLSYLRNPKEETCGKSSSGFDKLKHVYSNIKILDAIHSRELNHCDMRSISSSEPTSPRFLKGNCSSESGESTDHTIGDLPMRRRRLQDSIPINGAGETISVQPSSDSKPTPTDLVVGDGTVPPVEGYNCQEFRDYGMHLIEMLRVVNDAYKVQVAADVHLIAGYPITDLETFIYSATPVIGHVPCIKNRNCSWDQAVGNSFCQLCISNVSLRNIWEWYEEPGCYGLEVKALSDLSSETARSSSSSEFFAYFVPYLSAIQLFGWSRKNMDHSFGVAEGELLKASNTAKSLRSHPADAKMHKPFQESNPCFSESPSFVEDHGELMFEYFETEQPSFRPPLFEKIKELCSGANVSDHRMFGDPGKLQNVKLCDLHPASWFCVAWYPVYRVPRGNFHAAFLTYHSLGKLVPQKCSLDVTGGHTRIVSPVIGLQSYNDKGEQWSQLRFPGLKQSAGDDSSKNSRAEVLKERLRTLKMGALAMARAVIPKGNGESVNHHPDYEFFMSRCT